MKDLPQNQKIKMLLELGAHTCCCLQNGKYQRMANLYGDVWEASLFGNAPLSLKITDNYGRTLVAP